ncbi:MAG TPA: hypothetical protein VMU94_00650 [Streptosporangiaceae bacterium]|nr:hypothetical protein [Streptosporangiaceae bacterium]
MGGTSALLLGAAAWAPGPVLAAPRNAVAGASSVPSPGQSSRLSAVAAVAPGNAWAVGSYCPSHCKAGTVPERYMIMHWNGKAWSLTVNGSSGLLNGVSAASASDVWAVGSSASSPLLFLHWNGKSWSRRTATIAGAVGLRSVDTLSSSRAWAVGSAYSPKAGAYTTLIVRWNGSKWSRVAAPSLAVRGGSASLSTVSADSAKDAWAAGNFCVSGCRTGSPVYRGAILHWNGSKWSQSALPVRNSFQFFAVTALSSANAWAVGDTIAGHAATTLMLHWNGTKWSKVSVPNDNPSAMTFTSPADGWAVGLAEPVLHWNGATWTSGSISTPNWGGFVNGASGDSPADVWVVGDYCTTTCTSGVPITRGFTLHWNGSKWSRV